MKNFYLTISVLFLFIIQTEAQDLIVTLKNDSLNSKIKKIDKKYLHFTFMHENEIRNTLLPLTEVKYYEKDFFNEPLIPLGSRKVKEVNYPKWRISGSGGYSYLTARIHPSIPSDFRGYFKELKSGIHYGADLNYFFSEYIGTGIKYSFFHTENETDIVVQNLLTGEIRSGKMRDDISINFIGPVFCTRIISSNGKSIFLSNLALGYLSYTNNAIFIDSYILKSATFGSVWDIGMDFILSSNWAFGLMVGLTSGTLTEYEHNDGTTVQTIKLNKENYESISRFDASIGVKWTK